MAKIQNPQNERGETLATDKRVTELVEERLVPVEEAIETIISETIPESKIDVSNLDDDDAETELENFVNLNKINFVGRFVNVTSNKDGEITVYINEDNSLPAWNKTANFSPASESRYVYSTPENSGCTGNTKCSYVATTPGIHDLTISYSGPAFTLTKYNYNFKVSYKVNGTAATPIIIPLGNKITSERLEETTSVSFNEDNLTFNAKKLGNDILNGGKTPGNLEVESFTYILPGTLLAEGSITDITISFEHDIATDYTLTSPKKIYLWTIENNNAASIISSLKAEPNFTFFKTISGLKYVDSENSDNTVKISLSGSNLASGSLKNNKISLTQSGFAINTENLNNGFILNDTDKAHEGNFSTSIPITKQNIRGALTITASIPNPSGDNTQSSTSTNTYSFYSISKKSTYNTENFYDESYRQTSEWKPWNSEKPLISGEAVVQSGKLYHTNPGTNTGWKDVSGTGSNSNYKNLTPAPCSYFRTFTADPNSNTNNQVSIFYISGEGVSDIFKNEDKVEVRVWQFEGNNIWESGNGWLANKVRTDLNDGLASPTLENNRIVCTLKKNTGSGKPESGSTRINDGIRMEIKIKDSNVTVRNLTVTFI